MFCRNSDTSYEDRGSRGRDRRRGMGRGLGRGVGRGGRRWANERHAAAIAGELSCLSVMSVMYVMAVMCVSLCCCH